MQVPQNVYFCSWPVDGAAVHQLVLKGGSLLDSVCEKHTYKNL